MYAVSDPEPYTAPTPTVVLTPILPEATTTPITPTPEKPTVARATPTAADSAPSVESAAPSLLEDSVDPAQTATIKIGDQSFTTPVLAGAKVMDAMQALQAAGHLTYTSQEYPGMGLFIDSINGKKNADGMYWILYINETSSGVGASSATIGRGDTVEWRYKNAY
jgi:hypothetical protein